MKIIRNFSAFVALIILAGCSTTTDSTSQNIGPADVSSGTAVHLSKQDLQGYDLDPIATAEVWYEATMAIQPFINQYLEGGITAEKLDAMADEITAGYTHNPAVRKMVPALVSHKTLNALLENGNGAEDIRPYIAEHTEILVELNSPHAEDIGQALEILDGYWDEAKIKSFAEKTVADADDYLARSAKHTVDEADKDYFANDAFNEQLEESKAKTKTDIGSGIQSLERLLEE